MSHPGLYVGESILLSTSGNNGNMHNTLIYGVVIDSRNLERSNQNYIFQMTTRERITARSFTCYA